MVCTSLTQLRRETGNLGTNDSKVKLILFSRTITLGINEGMSILGEVPSEYRQDSYIIFSQQILQASKIKSCEAYDLISKSYSEFLESDFIYKGLYSSIGSKFFGKEAQKSGILGLLS